MSRLALARAACALLVVGLVFSPSGCGFYFKTYRFKDRPPFFAGMSEQEVKSQWGSPLSVQIMGPAQVWKYLAAPESQYGKAKSYHLVWLQDGQVMKWEAVEEEKVPPAPAT